MKLIQFRDAQGQTKVGLVEEEKVNILHNISSTYHLFSHIFRHNIAPEEYILSLATSMYEDYPQLLEQKQVLLPVAHPDPYHTWITGTGLTHLGSAASRNQMHEKINISGQGLTDSMKMFKLGLENGKMLDNIPASQPEWFYKGNGLMAVHPGSVLPSPPFALDAGEEPEVVSLYLIDADGNPRNIGFALGNEFSDHQMERINYLYLAHSKLRHCSYGPELLVGELPSHITGKSRIIRNNSILWEKEFVTGEDNMSHNLANLLHHHFKYPLFRQPGDVHVHFLGTSVLSFSDGIQTQDGDIFEIEAEAFGKPLQNTLSLIH